MQEPLLNVCNLKKYFKTGDGLLYAVDDISFSLNEGETLGLVGSPVAGNPPPGVPFSVSMSLREDRFISGGRTF